MANAFVDPDTCIGCGLCESLSPDCFEIGDEGFAVAKEAGCHATDLSELEATAKQCPVNAISVES